MNVMAEIKPCKRCKLMMLRPGLLKIKKITLIITQCRGPNVVIDDGQVDAPNSQLISCLDSSLGRAFPCSAGGRRFAPRP